MLAVVIIVVAVPEGLAMSVTLSLAYSMRKMTKSNNLVRKMHACETIGAATVICSDKTGTLTMNEMRVSDMNFPIIKFNQDKMQSSLSDKQKMIFEAFSVNSTANLSKVTNQPVCSIGNPTECALLMWMHSNNIDYVLYRDDFETEYQWTFTTEKKYMATIGRSKLLNKRIFYIKGAPEIVLNYCSSILTDKGIERLNGQKTGIEKTLNEYQTRGMRTLGFGYAEIDNAIKSSDIDTILYGWAVYRLQTRSDLKFHLQLNPAAPPA